MGAAVVSGSNCFDVVSVGICFGLTHGSVDVVEALDWGLSSISIFCCVLISCDTDGLGFHIAAGVGIGAG